MTADSGVERSIGRIEGKLEGIVATLKRVDDRSVARDQTLESVLDRLDTMEAHATAMAAVAKDFTDLKQVLRDGKMTGRGIVLGVALAAGAGGATVATFFKGLWSWLGGS